ncbi:MFS transporter [Saccharopolyspora sp. TS4A08]|uniref:MFS transporter n=1 Tax=Saccharopolyspora ipomoeae TaxID=3042027 RepID=A0ABT6PRB9_9PSEU|nr:MFS transporter [Saccharopolyspora sp. TS4A08]MDI2030559.1 MFS transporter [Saccharopolyspora sp. TS4A08]
MTESAEKRKLYRVVAAAMSGTAVEWYDFAVYGTAATLVFSKLFFPGGGDPLSGVIEAFVTYAVGFAARPLGGAVFGHFGDKYGRKRLLQVSLVLIGTSTFLMGLLPTFQQVGYAAPLALVILRFVQGFAVGGEWGGAVLLIAEHSPDNRRGFWTSFVQAAAPVGNVIAALVLWALSSVLDDASFLSWGWRIAFLLSAVIALVGWYVRTRIEDAPIFKEAANRAKTAKPSRPPMLEVIRTQPRNLLIAIGLKLAENIWYWIVAAFSVTYLNYLGIKTGNILLLLLTAQFLACLAIVFFGHLCDRIGRKPVYLFGIVTSAAFSFAIFPLYRSESMVLTLLGICVGLITWSAMYAPQSALMAEMFPTRVRYSGVSIGYQFSSIFAGSLAPIIATALLQTYGASLPISLYVATAALLSLVALFFARESRGNSLRDAGLNDEQSSAEAVPNRIA